MDWLHIDYLWILIAGPIVTALYYWASNRRVRAYRQLGDQRLIDQLTATVSARRRRWKAAFVTLAVLLIGVAAIGPRFGTQVREVQREGIDLIVALDVSLSMQAEDVAPNRLERSKNEIKKLLEQMRGDRVGLVLFAGDAFIQCPLTTDYNALRLFIDVADPSLIPTPGTDFGAALRMAEKAFANQAGENEDPRTHALLFISDGENHVADVDEIGKQAREAGILLFAAGVGELQGVPIPTGRSRSAAQYKKDRQGRVVMTKLEEAPLRLLSEGGSYFRIAKTSSSLHKITAELDRLEKAEFGTEEFEEYDEKYQWPLALALFVLVGEHLFSDRRRTRIEKQTE